MQTIIIVGGGFSGTVLAANLLRQPPARPTTIVLVERRSEIGRGVAYAARGPEYLLNVPAGRMSASSAAPNDFLEFARTRDRGICPETFLPREWYGDYLQHVLRDAVAAAPPTVRLDTLHGEATQLSRAPRASWELGLADGERVHGSTVVLACGNPPPRDPCGAAALADDPRYVRDSCAVRDAPLDGTVLLIGTGLTMADTAIAAADRPHVLLHAISRHGLVPMPQHDTHSPPLSANLRDLLLASADSVRTLLRAARVVAAAAEQSGGDWRDAINLMREIAPALWQRLPDAERRRFLRHLRSYWDLHRHRLPPAAAARIAALRGAGRLQVHAGRIAALDAESDGIRVRWRGRGTAAERSLLVDWVVNCTGPDYDARRCAEPLLRHAVEAGHAAADERGLGLRTGRHGAVVGAAGVPTPNLYYLGPMLRAAHWEATAVGELRQHAERLALHLAQAPPTDGAWH